MLFQRPEVEDVQWNLVGRVKGDERDRNLGPEYLGGGTWDGDKAWTFLDGNANMAEGFLRFELDRYLGWPGQAPSYKVGQRLWEQIRDEARTAAGEDFSLKDFHRRALDIGSVGLDTLRDALRG